METIKLLKTLKNSKQITIQQYRTFKGQILSGNEIGCIKGLLKKHLIDNKKAEELITSYALSYTE